MAGEAIRQERDHLPTRPWKTQGAFLLYSLAGEGDGGHREDWGLCPFLCARLYVPFPGFPKRPPMYKFPKLESLSPALPTIARSLREQC